MKILLVKPKWNYPITKEESTYNRVWLPLSLAYCAAILQDAGFEVKILDAHAERIDSEKVASYAKYFDKVFITSSSLDRWQCPNLNIEPFLQIVAKIRGNSSEVYVMGYHGTVAPNAILKMTDVKAVIRGEPEFAVLDICIKEQLSEVEGITYQSDGKVVSTIDRKPFDLNALPLPALSLLNINRYSYELLGKRFSIFEGSRSCVYECMFCQKIMVGSGVRVKSIDRLIQEVDRAIVDFGVETAYFIDLEFTHNKKFVEGLCDYFIKTNNKLRWCCQTRPDDITKELLIKMKRAGCKLIHYGIETGSPRIMELINKKISLTKIEEIVKFTETIGIKALCFFMVGFPTESVDDMEQTIRFAKKLNPTYISFHVSCPYPGSEFYTMIKDDTDELFPQAYTKEQDLATLKRVVHRALVKFYLRPNYLISRIMKRDLSNIMKQFYLFWEYIK